MLQVEDGRVRGQTHDLFPAQMRQMKTVVKQGVTISVNEDRCSVSKQRMTIIIKDDIRRIL